jgi:hypothetical protein
MIHENVIHSSSPVQYWAGLFGKNNNISYKIVLNTENMKEICMAKLITDLTEYWKFDIHHPLQYSTKLDGKYNNTSY